MSAQRYPLAWPVGWKRSTTRKQANFHGFRNVQSSTPGGPSWKQKKPLELGEALQRLYGELRRLGVRDSDVIISSDLKIRQDGLPYSAQAMPRDPGVAVYFTLRKQPLVLACDTWTRIPDNIAAVAAHIECVRGMDRYGVGRIEQAFAGYAALPMKGSTWRTTLGFEPDARVNADDINNAFRERARSAHPDVGGSHDAMASLSEAKTEGLRELETR